MCNDYYHQVVRYIDGKLSSEEKSQFEHDLSVSNEKLEFFLNVQRDISLISSSTFDSVPSSCLDKVLQEPNASVSGYSLQKSWGKIVVEMCNDVCKVVEDTFSVGRHCENFVRLRDVAVESEKLHDICFSNNSWNFIMHMLPEKKFQINISPSSKDIGNLCVRCNIFRKNQPERLCASFTSLEDVSFMQFEGGEYMICFDNGVLYLHLK